ncbi:MAG: DUF6880 family protein [Pedobacter sp.]
MNNSDFKELITTNNLRALAGGRSFERGEEYNIAEASTYTPSSSGGKKTISGTDIRTWLELQDPKMILDMLMVQLASDGRLREELVLKITKEKSACIDLTSYRKGLRAAFHTGGFIDYDDMSEFTDGIDDELDKLDRLLEEGFATETMQLCEFAFELTDKALDDCDDSNGYFSYIAERLGALHLEACSVAKPDPVQLARRLFAIELKASDMEFCCGATDNYKEVLGQEGLAEYQRLAKAEWAQAIAQGTTPSRVITGIMESLALADGDVDALIAIKKLTLTSANNFLDIAEICRKAGRADEALEWAEKGLQAFPKNTNSGLLDFLAEEYHRCKRYDEAYRHYWTQFADYPDLHHYIKLLDYAKKINRNQAARDEALVFLRKKIQHDKADRRERWGSAADHSRLVEIFLWEKDTEAAWNEAKLGGCNDHLWLKLATVREKDYPLDTVPVYQRMVEPIISRMKNDAYEEATRMVKHISDLMNGIGQQAEFAAYLADLKLRHKLKRNLMKLLAGV